MYGYSKKTLQKNLEVSQPRQVMQEFLYEFLSNLMDRNLDQTLSYEYLKFPWIIQIIPQTAFTEKSLNPIQGLASRDS